MLDFNGSTQFQSDELLSDFQDSLEESGSLPYVQAVADVGKQVKKTEGNPVAYGICINEDNADAVNFTPDSNWVEGEDIIIHPLSPGVIKKGWVARSANMVIMSQSGLEVQEKRGDGDNANWWYLGPQYEGRKQTAAGKLYEDHKEIQNSPYRLVRRMLVLFLDDQFKPLHESPLQFSTRGAFGTSLSKEYEAFQLELATAYRTAVNHAAESNPNIKKIRGGVKFDAEARRYTVFPVKFGPYIPSESNKSPYVCVAERYQPIFPSGEVEEGAQSEISAQGVKDRKVKITYASYTNFMIPKNSEIGRVIAEMYEGNENFHLPNRGIEATTASAESGERPYSGEGTMDLSTLELVAGTIGTGNITLMTDDGPIPLHFPDRFDAACDHMNIRVQGTIPADGGPVVVTSWESLDEDDTPAAAPVEQGTLTPAF